MAVGPVPEGYHTITPYLTVSDLPRLVRFMIEAFDGKQTESVPGDSGEVTHAEVRIGDSMVLIGQARGEGPFTSMSRTARPHTSAPWPPGRSRS